MQKTPTLTIVLPVYNGQNFLAEAIASILSQTYSDFELLISDNNSTDSTIDICERYAARDSRVHLFRFPQNVGASKNFNHLVSSAKGKYFKWAAHDDVCAPTFLQECIDVLESDESVALCHTYSSFMSGNGEVTGGIAMRPGYADADPVRRFESIVAVPHSCVVVFGLFRKEILIKTPLLAPYVGSDRNLLAEIALYGRIFCVPQFLFFNRRHTRNSVLQFPDERARLAWFDPQIAERPSFPISRRVAEYLASIERSPLSRERKAACKAIVREWVSHGKHIDGGTVRRTYLRELRGGAPAPITIVDESDQVHGAGSPQSWGKVGRNELCPCGSGKRYKHCHGALV